MSKFFSFFEESIVITKRENVSIYNLMDGNIYYFDNWKSDLIKALNNYEEIDQLCITYSANQEISQENIMDFLLQLELANIGKITTDPIVKLDLVEPDYWRKLLFFKSSPSVSKSFIIFGADCKKGCLHCDGEAIISENRCYSCSRSTTNPSLDQVERFINVVEILGCKELVLVGGDLLLDANILSSVMDIIPRNMSTSIICGYQDSYNNDVFKALCQCEYVRIEVTIDELETKSFLLFSDKIKGINSELYIINQSQGKNHLSISLPKTIKDSFNLIKEVRLIRKKDLEQILKDEEKGIPSTGCREYMYKNIFNTCMNGVLTMKDDGNLFVCPKINKTYLGNLNEAKAALQAESIDKYWELTKKKVKICEDCSLNVTCLDCRYLAYFLYGDLYEMYPCTKIPSRIN